MVLKGIPDPVEKTKRLAKDRVVVVEAPGPLAERKKKGKESGWWDQEKKGHFGHGLYRTAKDNRSPSLLWWSLAMLIVLR
jgi:hypothetical protein